MTHVADAIVEGGRPSQLNLIARIWVDPEGVAVHVRAGATATMAMAVFAGASAVISWAGVGPTMEVLRHDPSLAPEQAARAAELLSRFRGLIALTTPALLLLKWALIAMVVWMACMAAGAVAAYQRIFTMVVYCSGVQVLHLAIGVAIMMARADAAASLVELQPLTGLNLFWPGVQGPVAALLSALNPFDVWFVVALATGVRILTGARMATAVLSVLPAWIFFTGLQMAVAGLQVR